MTIGHPQVYEKYRIDSGNKIPKHGSTEYSLITETGNGFAFMDNGNHLLACDGTSHETVGHDIESSTSKNRPYQPTKWIKAESGDILFEAPQGTIYLKAKNILIESTGADPDGNIFLTSCNDVYIKSTDSVTITGTNVTVSASKTASLIGKSFTNIASNFVSLADTTEITKSITSLDSAIEGLLKFMEMV